MTKHPKLFTEGMERNMARTPEIDRVTHSAALYAVTCAPDGNQRTLGYLATLLSRMHTACAAQGYDRVRFLALARVMDAEQSTLDQNSKAAWMLVGIEQPPWKEWTSMDVEGARWEHADGTTYLLCTETCHVFRPRSRSATARLSFTSIIVRRSHMCSPRCPRRLRRWPR